MTANRQARAVAAIRASGGGVRYEYNVTDWSARPTCSPWLLDIVGVDFLYKVVEVKWISRYALTDDQLRHLQHLPDVKTLMLCGETDSSDALRWIGHMRRLEDLSLGIKVDDEALDYLDDFQDLQKLYLMGPSPDSRVIRLYDPKNNKRIWRTGIYNSNISAKGINRLATSLPHCRITY